MVDILIKRSKVDVLFLVGIKITSTFLYREKYKRFNVFGILISVDIAFKCVSNNIRQIIII